MLKDITDYGKKITVLREYGEKGKKIFVCQGDNFHKGLNEKYKEFNNYTDAANYFHLIKG